MRRIAIVLAASSALTSALLVGCGEPPVDAPPTIRAGRDECAECGMLVADERCAAASIVEVDGERTPRLFDDLGCLLDWERSHADEPVRRRFARDQRTSAWIDAATARFLMSDAIPTPMASGIVAFADAPDADAARERSGGTLFSWPELPEARVRWLEARSRAIRR